ncbi:hypothetical protein HMPREF1051_0835 [Neisseria sicca VK64]|uniref:Uncharacterized protein n=1 Tax=Neisseria sicca VK64 TaxID=1095748 RepID=I2NMR6_NEISI|nr:hypothetical protein HMPREF1051_0835 [Neisseria sicca VK64]
MGQSRQEQGQSACFDRLVSAIADVLKKYALCISHLLHFCLTRRVGIE